MRKAELSAAIPAKDGGFTAKYIKANDAKSCTLSVWTHAYHKPYAFDWAEARAKAHEKVDKK